MERMRKWKVGKRKTFVFFDLDEDIKRHSKRRKVLALPEGAENWSMSKQIE